MFTHHQTLLFVAYIEAHTEDSLLSWAVKRKIRNQSVPERQYIKNKIKEAPYPKEPQILLYTFLKYSGYRSSKTLNTWMEEQDIEDVNHKTRLANLATHLNYLDIPTLF